MTAAALLTFATWWKVAMIALLPLMLSGPKLRVWCAMFAASCASLLIPHAPAWIFIDLIAGALVLRRPAGVQQRLIGLLFAGMAIYDIGFVLGGQRGVEMFTGFLAWLGWVQFGILLTWGAHDAWGHHFRWHGPVGRKNAARSGS